MYWHRYAERSCHRFLSVHIYCRFLTERIANEHVISENRVLEVEKSKALYMIQHFKKKIYHANIIYITTK